MSEKVVTPPIAVVPCSGPCFDFTVDGERRERATVFIAPIAIRPRNSENIYVSWGCIPSKSLVCTPHGERDIFNIKEGNTVYSYDLEQKKLVPTKVVKTLKRYYVGNINKIKPYRLPAQRLTPEHPILVRIYKQVISRGNYRTEVSEPHWLKTTDIFWLKKILKQNYGICVALPFPNEEIDQDELDDEKLFLLGWYMAEGNIEFQNRGSHIRPVQVRFTLNEKEGDIAQKIQELTKKHFGANSSNKVIIDKRNGNRYRSVRVYSVRFARFTRKWCQGKKARTKKFRYELLTLPKRKQSVLLDAMFQGDGWKYIHKKTPTTSWSSASRRLAHQVLLMAIRLKKPLGFSEFKSIGGYSQKERPTFQVSYYEGKGKNRHFFIMEDNIVWTPISKITLEHFDGFVYNLETEEPHNYISSFLMHNCSRGIYCLDRECRYAQTKGGQRRGEGEIDRRAIEPFGSFGEEH